MSTSSIHTHRSTKYTFLPDELLKEILVPALQVPDDSFACTSQLSPFWNYNPTTSAYLLVCKDWLRVATPLLYSVVVLRSRAQIEALEAAIDSTPILGGLIKKLRVESGYCGSLSRILREAKSSLTDLCLSLEVYSSDQVVAACQGIGFVNPQRLIILRPFSQSMRRINSKAQQFMDTIKSNVENWDKLTTVVLPSSRYYYPSSEKYEDFIYGFCKSKSIQVVSMELGFTFRTWLDRFSKIPTLKKIIVRAAADNKLLTDALKGSPTLQALVQCSEGETSGAPRAESSQPQTQGGMIDTKTPCLPTIAGNWLKIPDVVWTKIFFYAMGLHELEQGDLSQVGKSIDLIYRPKHRRHLPLVCKKFHELALPLYYHCIIILDDEDLSNLVTFLGKRRNMGKRIESLYTTERSCGKKFTNNLCKLLSYTPNLKRVYTLLYSCSYSAATDIFDWQALSTLAEKAGPRVLELAIHLHRTSQPKSTELFSQFLKLQYLDFSSAAKFSFDSNEIDKTTFNHLETVVCSSINDSFLLFLSSTHLPNIRNARFPILDRCRGAITFLRKHGTKLMSLELGFLPGINVFDMCPNLEKFIVPREKPGFAVGEYFSSSAEHPLQVLHITTSDVARGAEREKFKYIGELDLSNFTSLRELRVDRCSWPSTEHEIDKSHWVAWAERLQDIHQVDIIDKQGQKWVPRLKAKKTK